MRMTCTALLFWLAACTATFAEDSPRCLTGPHKKKVDDWTHAALQQFSQISTRQLAASAHGWISLPTGARVGSTRIQGVVAVVMVNRDGVLMVLRKHGKGIVALGVPGANTHMRAFGLKIPTFARLAKRHMHNKANKGQSTDNGTYRAATCGVVAGGGNVLGGPLGAVVAGAACNLVYDYVLKAWQSFVEWLFKDPVEEVLKKLQERGLLPPSLKLGLNDESEGSSEAVADLLGEDDLEKLLLDAAKDEESGPGISHEVVNVITLAANDAGSSNPSDTTASDQTPPSTTPQGDAGSDSSDTDSGNSGGDDSSGGDSGDGSTATA